MGGTMVNLENVFGVGARFAIHAFEYQVVLSLFEIHYPEEALNRGDLMGQDGNDLLEGLVSAIADAVADRVVHRLTTAQQQEKNRLLDISEAAEYIGRTQSALRHLIARGVIPSFRRDGRVQLDRSDLDAWIEMGKSRR
jgi:excisionase family DNA binding protein